MELSSNPPVLRRGGILVVLAGIVLCLSVVACTASGTDDTLTGPEADERGDDQTPSDELATTDEPADDAGTVPESFFDGSVTVVVPNSPGTISTEGQQRVMAALVGSGPNAYLGGPDLAVTVRYSLLDDEAITAEVEGEWLTTNASALGLYVAPFTFDRAGLWELTVLADGREVGGALVEVVEESVVPSVGDQAPVTASPTGSTIEEIATISTDPVPDPGLYDLSLDEALANGRPTVVAFATPAFCRTALCGPTLATVKAATAGRDDIDVVHIEPYDIRLAIGGLLEPVAAMTEWGLVTEPWVFVVDAEGVVAAGFEGIIGTGELEAAIAQL